ncbi:hypothetical protein MBLNU459_g0715t1 [Dothideomycetes sp. NU459]
MSSRVILYDLPSKGHCACWSLNPWKTRLALNFKGIPYETRWLEYPDIAPTLKAAGLPPNEKGASYSIPAASIDGKLLMDSAVIAPVLEELQASPPMHFDHPMTAKVQDAVLKAFTGLAPLILPAVARNLLNPGSKEYFEKTRAERFGMPLPELEKSDKAKNAWETAEAGLSELRDLLREDVSGPFFLGKEPSYADFVAVGAMQFMKRAQIHVFERYLDYDDALKTLYGACTKWLERDDH